MAERMYRYVAGINPVEGAPGFKKARIAPLPNDQLGHAKATVRTQYGKLSSGWKYEDGLLTVEVEVPFNADAEIELPYADGAAVTENGAPIQGTRFFRGSGVWKYAYKPQGDAISRHIIEDVLPSY